MPIEVDLERIVGRNLQSGSRRSTGHIEATAKEARSVGRIANLVHGGPNPLCHRLGRIRFDRVGRLSAGKETDDDAQMED